MKLYALLFFALPLVAQADAPLPYSGLVNMADILSALGPSWNAGGQL